VLSPDDIKLHVLNNLLDIDDIKLICMGWNYRDTLRAEGHRQEAGKPCTHADDQQQKEL
jgi:hypothetical protein